MVLRKLRTKMFFFLWFMAGVFIVFIFVEWGMSSTSTRKLSPQERGMVGMVNKSSIPYHNYSNLIEYYRKQGVPLWKCRDLAFNTLVEEALLNEILNKRKIVLSDEEVVELIQNNPPPALLEDTLLQTGGNFDINKYHEIIANPANIKWLESYESAIRDQVPRQLLYQIITSATRPTTSDLVEAYMVENTQLEIEYAVIDSTQFNITEPMLLEYYNTHKNEFIATESPIINYVVFNASIRAEDETYIEDGAKEVLGLAKNGAPLESLAIEYGYPIKETITPTDLLTGPIKKEDGYHIIKGNIDLCIPIRPSDETIARTEEEATSFIESAKEGFSEAAKSYKLQIHKIVVENPVGNPAAGGASSGASSGTKNKIPVDLSYIDLKTKGKLIGPIEGQNCFYVIYTLGVEKAYTPDFYEIKDEVYNTYWKYKANEMAQLLIPQVSGTNFNEILAANNIVVKTKTLSQQDSLEDRQLFLKSLNIPQDKIAKVETNGIYLIHCLKRDEPAKEEIEKSIPQFGAKWMKEEARIIYTEWIQGLKEKATIKDYRYKIY
ncbi:MAG: SurA N-terminal domain-containing protein [Candidatus Stahlbacteria bacterium]|nr:SurA N-terminal domain-containing protein [Candidatus Stahlbacteria bacterium]